MTSNATCSLSGVPTLSMCLTPFVNLRDLTWRYFSERDLSGTIRTCLREQSKTLKKLLLILDDPSRRPRATHHNYLTVNEAPNKIVDMIRGKGQGGGPPLQMSLEDLSLSNVDIKSLVSGLSDTFNIDRLRALKLIHCEYSDQLLNAIVTSGLQPRLKVFAFVKNYYTGQYRQRPSSLTAFLHTFQGLETIYIKLGENGFGEPIVWNDVAQGALCHQTSLKRMVLQGASPPYLAAITAENFDANIPEMVHGTRLTCIKACIRCARIVSSPLDTKHL